MGRRLSDAVLPMWILRRCPLFHGVYLNAVCLTVCAVTALPSGIVRSYRVPSARPHFLPRKLWIAK